MRLIDADALISEIRKAGVYKSDLVGNWWNGRPRDLPVKEIEKIIKGQTVFVPPPEEPARLLTEEDFDKSNPMLDERGCLPCVVENDLTFDPSLCGEFNHWSVVTKEEWMNWDPDQRLWTKIPTKQQMEETPWGDNT